MNKYLKSLLFFIISPNCFRDFSLYILYRITYSCRKSKNTCPAVNAFQPAYSWENPPFPGWACRDLYAPQRRLSAICGLSVFCTNFRLRFFSRCASCTIIACFSAVKLLYFAFFISDYAKKRLHFPCCPSFFHTVCNFFTCQIAFGRV